MAAHYENHPFRSTHPQSVSTLIASRGLDAVLQEDFEETRTAEEKMCWYHGKIPREAATKLLKEAAIKHQVQSASEAVYLVRERDCGKCLSVLVEDRVFHVIIEEERQGYFYFQQCDVVQGLECLIGTFSGGITGEAGLHAKLTQFPIGTPPPPASRKTGHTTLLHKAVVEGKADLVQQILDHPLFPDVNSKDSQGSSALHLAASKGYADVVRILLNAGAYINMADRDGLTALHRACTGYKESTVKLLVQEGHCHPDVPCVLKGWTPLHYAAKTGSVKCVKTLLSLNASADLKGFRSETARDVAEICERLEVLRLLDGSVNGLSDVDANGETQQHASLVSTAVSKIESDLQTNCQMQRFKRSEEHDTESWNLQRPVIPTNREAQRSKTPEEHTTQSLKMGVSNIQPNPETQHFTHPEELDRPHLQVQSGTAQSNGEIQHAQLQEEHETQTSRTGVVVVQMNRKTKQFQHSEEQKPNRSKMGAAIFQPNGEAKHSTHPEEHQTQSWMKQTHITQPNHGTQFSTHPEEHKTQGWRMQTHIAHGTQFSTHPEEHKTPSWAMQAHTTQANHDLRCSTDTTKDLTSGGVEVVTGRSREMRQAARDHVTHETVALRSQVEGLHPWLHSKIDQWEAEKLFRQHNMQSGLFLVRTSEDGLHVLSVCADGKPYHHMIETTTHKGRVLFHLKFGPKVSSVDKLIDHFSTCPNSGLGLSCYIHTNFHVVELPGYGDFSQPASPMRAESIKKPVPSPPTSPREDKKEEDMPDSVDSYPEPGPRRLSDDEKAVNDDEIIVVKCLTLAGESEEDDADDAERSVEDDDSSESGSHVSGSYDVEQPDSEIEFHGRITRQSRVSRFISEPLYQWVAAEEIIQINGAASETKVGRTRDSCVYENVEFVVGKESALECGPADLSSGDEVLKTRRTVIQEVFSQSGALQRAMWCEMPEVIESGVLEQMNAEQKRVQETMFEIITSEASYLRSLNVLENVFIKSAELSGDLDEFSVIGKEDYDDLFSNIQQIRQISAEFLEDLEVRWQESYVMDDICDIIAAHAQSKFNPYVQYCGRQALQDKTLKRLSSRPDFSQAVKRLQGHRDCQSLSLYSFLMLPMQRITRLPLLVNAIQHCIINPASPQQDTAKEAFDCLQTLVTECNDEARRVQQTEYIQQLKNKMIFTEVKEFPLMSDTRYLEKEGELKKITTDASSRFKFSKDRPTPRKDPLYVFLFNDLLVVTKKKGENYKVQDYCPRQSVEVQVITKKEAKWLAGSSVFTFLLTLHSNHKGHEVELLLAADSESERTRWMEALSKGLLNTQRTKDYEDWDCPQVVCIETYTAQQPDEMSLLQTDAVSVRKKMDDGWYWGERLRDGTHGWFPASCTAEIENAHVRLRNLRMQVRVLEAVKRPSPKSKS